MTARTETGKGWEIRFGDSLRLLRDLEDDTVDAVITDPPYSSGGQYRSDRANAAGTASKYLIDKERWAAEDFAGDSRDQRGFLAWCSLWLSDAFRVTREGGVVVVFCDWRQLPTVTDAIQAGNWLWRGIAPWDKIKARPQMGRFRAQCEYVVWGSKGPMPDDRGVGCLPGLFSYPTVAGAERVHQTQKPVELMADLCRIVPGDGLILDPFLGFGSTGIGALRTGHRFLGFEMSPRHYDQALERLRAEDEGSTYADRMAGQVGLFGPL